METRRVSQERNPKRPINSVAPWLTRRAFRLIDLARNHSQAAIELQRTLAESQFLPREMAIRTGFVAFENFFGDSTGAVNMTVS